MDACPPTGGMDDRIWTIEQALNIANPIGRIGFILPHKFFTAQYGEGIRQVLLLKNAIKEIIHFGHQQVFINTTTYACILTLENQNNSNDYNF